MISIRGKGVVVLILALILGGISPISLGENSNKDLYEDIEVWYYEDDWPGNDGSYLFVDENNTLHIFRNIHKAVELVKEQGTIQINEGSYDVGRNPVEIKKPMNITGRNNRTTKVSCHCTSQCVFSIYADNVMIKNLTIHGAYYRRHEDNPIQSGIIIYNYEKKIGKKITLVNNIFTDNSNGITVGGFYDDPNYVIISFNNISKNFVNGVTIQDGSALISDNVFYENNNSGISFWGEKNNIVKNNTIHSNVYGIWNDHGDNNRIFNNTIFNNSYGIVLWAELDPDPADYNEIFLNQIIENNECGLLIGEANHNTIFNNTFRENAECGLQIMYVNAGCLGNTIYHNNFIDNGRHFLPMKKYCNGVDNKKEYNNWFNVDLKQGNYWSDYLNKTRVDKDLSPEDYKKTWGEVFGDGLGSYPLSFYFSIKLTKSLGLDICLDLLRTSKDEQPWVRKNGWYPKPPEKPEIRNWGFVGENNAKIIFNAKATDLNEDKIVFIGKLENDSGVIFDWDYFIENKSFDSNSWSTNLTLPIPNPDCKCEYNLSLKAIDERDGEHYGLKGFDDGKNKICYIEFHLPFD